MPIGRHRKPFSSKQKKEQLQAKRERKRNKNEDSSTSESESINQQSNEPIKSENPNAIAARRLASKMLHSQPENPQKDYNPNRFNLQFVKESQDELKRKRKEATKALEYRSETELEIDIDDVYKPSSPLDMPIRPKWTYEMTKEQLENQEKKYFAEYLNKIFENFKDNELSYFEMNLETWRQLWRVVEISDIILLIVDIRFPALHFSPKFYEYCTSVLRKDVILILNKIDLVSTSVVVAWKHFFEHRFPNLHIILFSSSKQIKHKKKRAKSEDKTKKSENQDEISQEEELEIKALAADIYTAKAHRQLYECVKNIVKNNVDLSSWSDMTEKLIENSTIRTEGSLNSIENLNISNEDTGFMDELYYSKVERKKFENGFVTIGCCGFPNVGKSSLLNSLNGRKVVSVSRTPGHTKHLQTIFLTKNVRLCDCPGLVFPSLVSKPLQILAGIYPIAQLQEPYSPIRFLAERIPVVDILKLKHPVESHNEKVNEWSPLDICEAWALKRGYFTAKASRPDTYRAANELLRMALDGRLCLSLKPKNFSLEKQKWEEHPETLKLNEVVTSVEKLAHERNKIRPNIIQEESDEEDEDYESESNLPNYVRYDLQASDDEEKKDETTTGNESDAIKIGKNPYLLLSDNE